MNLLIRILLIAAGTLCTGLGVIGIVVPVLPTTPFLLLAAFLYVRSSDRLYRWLLLRHRVLGVYIRDYLEHHAIRRQVRIGALVLLWGTLALSFWLVDITWVRMLLPVVGIGVTIHLMTLKTLKESRPQPHPQCGTEPQKGPTEAS